MDESRIYLDIQLCFWCRLALHCKLLSHGQIGLPSTRFGVGSNLGYSQGRCILPDALSDDIDSSGFSHCATFCKHKEHDVLIAQFLNVFRVHLIDLHTVPPYAVRRSTNQRPRLFPVRE